MSEEPTQTWSDEAFWQAVKELQDAARVWAHKCCFGDGQRAEDVVSESLYRLVVAHRRGRIRHESTLKTYYFGIICNVERESRRKSERLGRALGELRAHTPVGGATTSMRPEDALTRERLRARLLTLLVELPETQYQVLYLHEAEEMSFAEIANILEISKSSVQGRMERARAFLKERLEGEGFSIQDLQPSHP